MTCLIVINYERDPIMNLTFLRIPAKEVRWRGTTGLYLLPP